MRILSIRTGFLSYLYKGKSVNMKLENYEVHLPNYSIGDAIYDKIGPVCESYGKTVLVIGGKRALDAAFDKIKAAVDQTNLEIIGKELYGKDCTYQTVEKLRRMSVYQKADMVFGVGGGKALDTVKCLCITDDKPVFSFPTIASNCSACTSVSIMYNEDGTFLKPNFFVRPVMHAFIDTEIIAKAPSQYMWAGIGDTYAKYYEATISSRDERLEHFTSLGVAVSLMCRNPLLEYGPKAFADHNQEKGISAAERLDTISREELAGMLYENSDEPYCEELAKAITEEIRKGHRIDTTTKLRQVIEQTLSFLPENKEKKDIIRKTCQRTFQALRIDVNHEFEVLYEFMEKLPGTLKPGGRVAILTFHSGEDKLVKKALKAGYREGVYSEYAKDVVRPSAEECAQNGRARSTKMRWAVKAE